MGVGTLLSPLIAPPLDMVHTRWNPFGCVYQGRQNGFGRKKKEYASVYVIKVEDRCYHEKIAGDGGWKPKVVTEI